MMKNVLAHKKEIDADLLRLTSEWHEQWQQRYTPHSVEVLDTLTSLLNRGGKRLRGALAMESYYLHGGDQPAVALGAARVIELIQACLLTLDDIADNSTMRRGDLSVHIMLARLHRQQSLRGDDRHYGTSQAMNMAVFADHQAIRELLTLPAPDAAKIRAAELLSEDIGVTLSGQINDIYNEVAVESVGLQTIIDTLTWKTAYYTFISPLELGACLAGHKELDERLRQYALNAGVAFQISDDVLGTFGDSFEVGKSADDDIHEGKATLLVAHAQQQADDEQKQILHATLGNPTASKAECDQLRQIFRQTGAFDYAMDEAHNYADAAIEALGDQPEDFLVELVRFSVDRSS